MSTGGIILRGEDHKYSEKDLSSVTSSTINSIWTSLVLNPGKGRETPVNNGLTNGKAYVSYLDKRLHSAYGNP